MCLPVLSFDCGDIKVKVLNGTCHTIVEGLDGKSYPDACLFEAYSKVHSLLIFRK